MVAPNYDVTGGPKRLGGRARGGRRALDLNGVRGLLDEGMDRAAIARGTGATKGRVDEAWSTLTGLPLENDPTPERIEQMTSGIRSGWTHEQEMAARRGDHRDSSRTIVARRRRKEGAA